MSLKQQKKEALDTTCGFWVDLQPNITILVSSTGDRQHASRQELAVVSCNILNHPIVMRFGILKCSGQDVCPLSAQNIPAIASVTGILKSQWSSLQWWSMCGYSCAPWRRMLIKIKMYLGEAIHWYAASPRQRFKTVSVVKHIQKSGGTSFRGKKHLSNQETCHVRLSNPYFFSIVQYKV